METKIELERILAKLTGSQRTLVKGWYRRANMFADLVDNVVIRYSCKNVRGSTLLVSKMFSNTLKGDNEKIL